MEDEPQFAWGESMDDVLRHLQVPAVICVCRSYHASGLQTQHHAYEFIAAQEPITQGLIFNDCQVLLASPDAQTCKASWRSKHKRDEEQTEIRNIQTRLEDINAGLSFNGKFSKLALKSYLGIGIIAFNTSRDAERHRVDKLLRSDFMKTPSESAMKNIVQEFIERTGNEPLKTVTCACCALETAASEITKATFESFPNPDLLIPAVPHPEHDIFHEMLLEPRGVDVDANTVNICYECYVSLERGNIPCFALANNMWIGRVPECLQTLTLVERLLIAKYFPTAYVIKLFPEQTGAAHWDHSQLYSGFKGSVSTYALDPKLVVSMIDGHILPAPPIVLSATVAVTFITPSGKVEFCMPKILHVRRRRVREALEWLKAHNPLYNDIVISEERLEMLPEDGIPDEICLNVKHSTDMEAVIRCRRENVFSWVSPDVTLVGLFQLFVGGLQL